MKLTPSLKDATLKDLNTVQKPIYDKNALKERYKILGRDPEQAILNSIRKACYATLITDHFGKTLQTIKANFVQRDYEGIFTADAEQLQVYSAAYVPGRALCYFDIFTHHQPILKLLARPSCIYAIGSGSGSELVALAAAMTRVPAERQKVRLVMQDLGDWGGVLNRFESTTVREHMKITPEQLECTYIHNDILDPTTHEQRAQRIADADLITFMFVMNELFVKKAAAMELVQSLVQNMKKGAYLLVVESAGSFSHLKVGNKTYMVHMLLDAIKDLKPVVAEDSRWYRHPDHLRYPIDVQNMRYFIRLYKKL
ncbi:ylr063w-like protein [Lichtheimia corymbifera JMRC:FSU:9682]|uniref:Ylr063w-like protein n=1 Tax=Lichtheimia corymbifera JMRC:FSU:9682 TaxID=1263082 RepID=A0A068S7W8_9FUNG|nr:ylr063w-like protein [Lichtheimia corymbifera JMRC:FSU:9682]